jgi:two-component system, OmpR family, sensor kinase
MSRRVFPRSVRGRLLVVVAIVVGGALATMMIGFNLLLARSLDGDATRLARSRASAVLSTLHVQNTRVVVSEEPDDEAIDGQSWIFERTRAIESPPTTSAAARAARRLALSERGTVDIGDLRLAATPIADGGTRIGAVVAGVSLAPYEQTRRTALALSAALAALLFAVVLLVARSLLSHALRPVAVMTSEAAAWGAEESERRFDLGPPHDELTQLAATLDSLLDRLAASLRHERRFSAELSHELRTPLARILAQSEMMLARVRSANDYRDSLERIRESATQMTRTVETLVAEARLQASGLRGSCELAGVLATVVGASRESARQHGCRIELDSRPPGLRVGASADLVERIVQPIVENACSYGSSTVRISLARRGANRIEVRISDDGAGIVDDERERIFEPGFRGRAGDANERGAGLGLALARRLATSAGATIEAPRSSNGGLVVVELPAA